MSTLHDWDSVRRDDEEEWGACNPHEEPEGDGELLSAALRKFFEEAEREAAMFGLNVPLTHRLVGQWGRGNERSWVVDGRTIPLRQRSSLVLRILLKHRRAGGKFVTVAEIMDAIMDITGNDFWKDPSEQDVRRAIGELRNSLLSAGFSDEVIENRRGFGYRVNALRRLIFLEEEDD